MYQILAAPGGACFLACLPAARPAAPILFGRIALRFHQFPQSPSANIRARRELLLFGEPLRRLADAAPVDAVDGHDRSGAVFHFSPLGPRSQSASSSRRSTRRSGAGSASVSGRNPEVT